MPIVRRAVTAALEPLEAAAGADELETVPLLGVVTGGDHDAAVQVAAEDPDKLVVVILPDSGRGYLSKVFNDDWMRAHGFGSIVDG